MIMCRKSLFLISFFVILCLACTLYATIVTTADGNGADTFVTNDEASDKDSIMGTEETLEIRNYEGVRQRIGYLRFDISSVEIDGDHYFGGDLTRATLTLNVTGTQENWVSVYGVADGANDLWDEATLSYRTAPGVVYESPAIRSVPSGRYALDDAILQKLGQIQLGTGGLYSSDPNTLNMDYFMAQDTNKLITFIIINEQSDPEADWWITTKESDTPELAPVLNFPNALEPLKVIWVYDTINDSNSVQDDQFWIDWLVAAEYALNAEPDKWTELDTAEIAVLNDAGLIIFSLTADGNAYADDANEIAAWESITTPILNMEDWEQSEAGLKLFAEAINTLTEQPKVCTVDVIPPVLPAVSELPSIPKLPDPFKFMDGKRMTRLDDWTCRRSEISLLVQEYVYGPKPPRPSSVTGSYSDNQLTVHCSESGKSISFTVGIAHPPTGTAPYPAIINIGPWLTLPKTELDSLGIAVIYFPNDDLASQTSASARGKGKFYDLYGSDHQAGSLMAWAWGLSRLIDVLEQIPEANINPAGLGVTGCSRNGKGALVCGAFDERIALTIPTESGAGGASSWRVADALVAAGGNVQTARQIVTENTWMSPVFAQFGNRVDRLPVDQHMVAALCAPRPLLITENTAFEWLGPEACYTTAVAAHKVWEALGASDRMGFVQTSHGDHCGFKEIEELRAFCTKFLLDGQADTNVLKTDGNFDLNPSDWIDWDVPSLE